MLSVDELLGSGQLDLEASNSSLRAWLDDLASAESDSDLVGSDSSDDELSLGSDSSELGRLAWADRLLKLALLQLSSDVSDNDVVASSDLDLSLELSSSVVELDLQDLSVDLLARANSDDLLLASGSLESEGGNLGSVAGLGDLNSLNSDLDVESVLLGSVESGSGARSASGGGLSVLSVVGDDLDILDLSLGGNALSVGGGAWLADSMVDDNLDVVQAALSLDGAELDVK